MKPTGKKKAVKKTMVEKVSAGYCQNCEFYKRPRCTLNKSVVTRKCSCAEYQSVVKGR